MDRYENEEQEGSAWGREESERRELNTSSVAPEAPAARETARSERAQRASYSRPPRQLR